MAEVGYWRIYISLPENRDYKGRLTLYNPDGSATYSCDCLGRGSNSSVNNYNHSNWWMKNADTPTGLYEGRLIAASTDTDSFGPYKRIDMEALNVGDHADIAYHQYGRSGIQIHGGDLATDTSKSWYPLRPTYGCIRVSNESQKRIAELVSSYGGTGKVEVVGVQKEIS